ncbi:MULTISPECIES: MFS transporter [Variovorax]|uniref:MFS transporter n=1 Tax=Variovorax TaxID=34072 RepID=UPI00086F390F|nr:MULTISPECIES: MFS transporter [Variovorax]MBN8753498.1 MFS transporter [Variovorax sp.]ODU15779.1 MAG: MFS transporter [Variovorax sp. SCN 67-85]ODV27546.1 MAG: MFS transporter [Variovorax sp. SCN 67-20]OJZ11432.1 MAG: MFS transporter [Variovorax sp. 67-131]UKI05923.1 MFS transporter [Variovorax paradoxus]
MKGSELLRVIGAQVCLHATMAGMRLATPLLALQQGYSAAAVGVLISLFALTQVFLALPAGRFADRHGFKRPLWLSVIAAVVGAGLVVVFPVFPVMCLSALLTGGATGATVIALQRHVGRSAHDPTQLKRVFSWLAIAPAAANFVGPFLAGMLIDHAGRAPADMLAFRVCFAVMAALPLVCWLLARGADEPPLAPPLAGATPTRAWDLLREPMFRRLLFVNWLQSSSWDVHAFVLPVLGHDRGISASVIGSILGAFAVAAAVIRVVLPVIASRASERSVILSSTIVTALVFAVYPLLEAAWAMGVCSVILGFALGAVQPMVMSMLHQITPHTRHGEALGLRLMTINASSVAMPMLFGSLGALIGIAGVFWVVGGVLALGARATWGLKV